MRKVNAIAAALILSVGGSLAFAPSVMAAEKCPIDARKSKAVGQSVGKKVQKSFKAYTDGTLDEAIAILLEVNAKSDFDKAYLARMLGNFYAEKGQMTKALDYLKTAADANVLGGGDHAGVLRLYADILIGEKQYKQSIPQYYQWMAFTCKQDAQVYKRIGIAYSQEKQWDKVLEVADKAIALVDKPEKDLYQMKLTAYYNKKQYLKAVNVLETMVPLFQDDKRLWIQLAQFYLMTENYSKALSTYDLAYKNGFLSDDASSITKLSQLMAQKGSPYHGAKLYAKHMKSGLIVENEKTFKTLAGFYHNAKEIKLAAAYYGKAADVDNDGKLYLTQGRLLALDGNYKSAVPVLKKALDAGIKHPGEAQFELALAYLSLKQYKSAYTRAKLASKDKKMGRAAKSYLSYIEGKARIHNVTL